MSSTICGYRAVLACRSVNGERRGYVGFLHLWWITGSAGVLIGMVGITVVPDLPNSDSDQISPLMMIRFLASGLLGAGVAAMPVANMSTGAEIGTTVSGLVRMGLDRRSLLSGKAPNH